MSQNYLNWDETLFKNIELFDINYVPDVFNYREEQMQQLAFAIRPAMIGGSILPSVCIGLPGTGKTTSVKKLFDDIKENTQKIFPISVNCRIDSTEYAIFSRIYTKLTGFSQPSSGTSLKALLDNIAKYIQSNDVIPLICLDDANYLVYDRELNHVLYSLMRMHEEYDNVSYGVILVLSDLSIVLNDILDARVKSVFQYGNIMFKPYSASEMYGILSDRVKLGLYPKVISSDLLDMIIDLVMRHGDVRMGLDLIKRSVMYAENDSRKQVNKDDIEKAFVTSKDIDLTNLIRSLSKDEFLVFSKIVEMTDENSSPSSKNIIDVFAKKGPKLTRINEIFEKLDRIHLISMEYSNTGGGRRRYLFLKHDKDRLENIIHVAESVNSNQ